MDLTYDQKFEDMKKYIPFLESMIQRLESGSASANPRQAQLDKIRSLRDLLVDKKKRMKMENLLKCEQVLVNLYAKVEQREPGFKIASDMTFPFDSPKEKDDTDLSIVRNKLKNIVSKTNLQAETLPEIARASETEELCTPGSKEPALFQRRPNKSSISPSASAMDKIQAHNSMSKRNYTRLLKSPEPSSRRWSNENPSPNKPLFSRRSPRKSPLKNSLSNYKKERKKSSNQAKKYKAKDLNITLNVPEESLNSLNTDDILTRIINCSNGDVDISTLRDLRSQILGELKHTGAHEDISDLIMKSYKKKKKTKSKAKVEVEEGELSDSESEAIESIYGSLVLVDKDKNVSSEVKTSAEKEKQRKIQICLVINSDKGGPQSTSNADKKAILSNATVTDVSELEMFDMSKPTIEEKKLEEKQVAAGKIKNTTAVKNQSILTNKPSAATEKSKPLVQDSSRGVITIDDDEDTDKKLKDTMNVMESSKESEATCVRNACNTSAELILLKKSEEETTKEQPKSVPFTANFYKPLNDHITEISPSQPDKRKANEEAQLESYKPTSEANASSETIKINTVFSEPDKKDVTSASIEGSDKNAKEIENINCRISTEDVVIPLLNLEPVVPTPPAKQLVSEIDILQALKNEILSDCIAIPGTEAVAPPPLHQPKITKVSSAQEIINKKRISIEKYKESIVRKPSLHRKHSSNLNMRTDDHSKKQSLKLTEKECERFNLPAKKLALDDSSDDDEVDLNYSLDDIYGDLNAPKSPENDDIFKERSVTPPIIIPEDPIETAIENPTSDVDMRALMPILSPKARNTILPVIAKTVHTAINNETLAGNTKSGKKSEKNYIPPLMDPRLKLDMNKARESPNLLNPERTPRPLLNFSNTTPSMTPSRISNMTPNARTFERTPSHKSFEIEDNLSRKHVYAPIFPVYEQRDVREVSMTRDTPIQHNWELNNEANQDTRKSHWEHGDLTEGNSRKWEDHNSRASSIHRESASDYQNSRYNDTSDKHPENSINDRFGYEKRDGFSYSRLDCPRTPVHPFGRSDCPTTPTPSFGRLDTPLTPVHPFGRSDCPSTPNHPFARSDPTTPSHPFGRSDGSRTPSHPFGRPEGPSTPSHPFGRSEMNAPMTPSHQFGRSEFPEKAKYSKDPRLNRNSEHEASPRHYDDDKDRSYYKDGRNSDARNRPFNSSDNYPNYTKDQVIGRINRSYDKSGHYFNREQTSYPEPNVGRGGSRNYDRDRFHSRESIDHKQDIRYKDERMGYNEVESRRTLIQSAPNVGRSYDEAYNRSSRAPSVGRNYGEAASTDNTLSVKPQSGRSFIIDTSVNRTFQEFLSAKGLFDHSSTFDARRQRATSVERSLARAPNIGRTFRESSVGRTLSKPSHHSYENQHLKNRNQFIRAQSMGRELAHSKQEKSFKDIKAEFKSYSASYKRSETKRNVQINVKKMNYRDPRSRKELKNLKFVHEHEQSTSYVNTTKATYSPRKNNRDPRMRRDYPNDANRYITEDRKRDRKSYGIVYSSDNIAKGTILGPGYGVKNYKIPKIKRVVEEKQETEEVVEQKENTDMSKIDEKKQIKDKSLKDVKSIATDNVKKQDKKETKIVDKDKNQIKDTKLKTDGQKHDDACKSTPKNTNKRLTRSSLNSGAIESDVPSDKVTSKPRRFKKAVIYDSDSDGQDKKTVDSTITANKESSSENESKSTADKQSEEIENREDDILDDSFGIMEDLEIFPDNMVCDPVMNNINALIADLDNDIDNSKSDKNDQFTNEITLENMLENITSPDQHACTVDESLNDLDELINEDLNNVKGNLQDVTSCINENAQIIPEESLRLSDEGQHSVKTTQEIVSKEMITSTEVQSTVTENSLLPHTVSDDANKSYSYPIVSTTEIENQPSNKLEDKVEELPIQSNVDISSIPDSTINTEEAVQTKPCDSSIKIDPDITSTHDSIEKLGIDNNTDKAKEKNPQIESIGNLLSILQDKSKIKELLGMLGGPSIENEKIKKKLEKLSEIVSDDETSDNLVEQDVMTKELENTSKKVESGIQETMETNESKDMENQADTIQDYKPETNNGHKPETIEVYVPKSNEKTVKSKANNAEVLQKSVTNLEKEDIKKCNEISTALLDKPTKTSEITDSNEPIPKDIDDSELSSDPSKLQKTKVVGKIKRKGRQKKIKRPLRHVRYAQSQASNSLVVDKPKKESRELRLLQDDIKEMFISDDILNATGIRMCRLAKLVDDKTPNQEEGNVSEIRPVVVLEKVKDTKLYNDLSPPDKVRKKPGPKPKVKPKHKPGPKSKTRHRDPYIFESDTFSETSGTSRELPTLKGNNAQQTKGVKKSTDALLTSSDSESDSLASSKSFGSSEALTELKKKIKRKRGGWKAGFIKPNKKKKKVEAKQKDSSLVENIVLPQKPVSYPDMNCFTDKTYCFVKNISIYPCRLCDYKSKSIVDHYKRYHPHSEIPLSRMNPSTALEAIEQCEETDFQAISKIATDKYVCRFCCKEFNGRRKTSILEAFFWHVVSIHTGEYRQLCSECINVDRCPFNLDIPPPPKEVKGQLIGYICGKCNFTQISLENLKTHVIVRHNDEQTEVYTINLAVMTKKTVNTLLKQSEESPRILRSSRSNLSANEASDDRSDITGSSDRLSELDSTITKVNIKTAVDSDLPSKVQSKVSFEQDDSICEISNLENTESNESSVITKNNSGIAATHKNLLYPEPNIPEPDISDKVAPETKVDNPVSSDVADYAHFKINYTDTGAKEYVCCINNIENHYKTSLLISMKKHVQTKHIEKWDGYCFLCKNIVTSQGQHDFRECLQHLIDKHIDNFPIFERSVETEVRIESVPAEKVSAEVNPAVKSITPKTYINVRPMSELLLKEVEAPSSEEDMPKIQSVISLRTPVVEDPVPCEPTTSSETALASRLTSTREKSSIPEGSQKYEEAQDEVMRKKHQVVLESMKSPDKLIKIFKCAGRYCYFTSDNIDDALLHSSTHQRIGGENALLCSYCDFDCSRNAIALVMHVFKSHGHCQYSCGHCFYRAAASQLVRAHMIRIHGEQYGSEVVLKTETITPVPSDTSDMLTRDVAVQHYICADDENCKFRTYAHGKFIEHLMKHSPPHTCYICSTKHASSMELILHMKSHGLNVFQCTWCVYGADDETELLAHASAKHPSKQPQAYLRFITTKDGKMMVLPLAQYNKSVVQTQVVSPGIVKEHPIREAETSIELEKLIGSMAVISEPAIEAQPEIIPETAIQATSPSNKIESLTSLIPEPRLVTPPPSSAVPDDLSQQVTPVLKAEPLDETPTKKSLNKDVVFCLDSDEDDKVEDDSSEMVIDLSDDDFVSTAMDPKTAEDPVTSDPDMQKKIPLNLLYKCPKCGNIYKTSPAFKRHFQQCFPNIKGGAKCGHCSLIFYRKPILYDHYEKDHRLVERDIPHRGVKTRDPNAPNPNILPEEGAFCGMCEFKHQSVAYVKSHLKTAHGITNPASSYRENGELVYTAREIERTKPGPKRKLSSGTAEPPAKRKRYGPQDVHLLPTKPILDELVFCSLCEFSTKVRLNLVRHLQGHADKQPVAETVPVNPVPHLETNEKHFDKMVNLASSSIVTRAPEKPTRVDAPTVCHQLPLEAAARYPIYVPERVRYTCGAKGCSSYISINEEMLKCHWETLHVGSVDYHCVHCPPNQSLDKSKPLTAALILAHLKMHDTCLYACSACPNYHFKRQVIEKHVMEVHRDYGNVVTVREEWTASPMGASQGTAPTMDLKPWHCGLCKFKSMLRQEVVEHCAKIHSSKMQFKCPNCPFRTSTLENVTKHHSNSHPSSTEDVIYYYYREGSIPEESDGTPRWMRQRQKMGLVEPEVKAEVDAPSVAATPPLVIPTLASDELAVDLNIVKKETEESQKDLSTEDLCKKFGQFCDPNGLKFKCPLCSVVMEDTKNEMQSHLFEELKYRKWGCCFCSYKAFHQTGLNEHIFTEHNRQKGSPKELPVDKNVEKWVLELLDHQATMIAKAKENFAKQRIVVEKPRVFSAPEKIQTPPNTLATEPINTGELIEAFGDLGTSRDLNFYCPKCSFSTRDESAMRDHLESELNRIRWRCSNCSEKYQEYHEAQLHCRIVHTGQSARPVEAIRDPNKRTAWLEAVIRTQKTSMPERREIEEAVASIVPSSLDNSLLVVRYEERVPTPEEEMLMRRKIRPTTPVVPDTLASSDSDDDDRLYIGDPLEEKPKSGMKKCPHCDLVTKYSNTIREHIYRHYNLKPYMCAYCSYSGYLAQVRAHKDLCHHNQPHALKRTPKPTGPPLIKDLPLTKGKKPPSSVKVDEREAPTVICLVCEKPVVETQTALHVHNKMTVHFAKKGDVVVKCCNCLALLLNVEAMKEHHHVCHSNAKINYAFYKLNYDTRQIHCCGHCRKRFKFLRDLRSHHNAVHSSQSFQYTMRPYTPVNYDDVIDLDAESPLKRSSTDAAGPVPKRVAKKSTTKLPAQTVARKSTTKLPFQVESDSETEDDYSYYGKKPTSLQQYSNVTTMMPFCNTMMTFTAKKLSEIININPKIVVKDLKCNFSD